MSVKTVKDGDLFNSDCDALVNPVNCEGYSGALAGVFADRYPEMKAFYEDLCAAGLMKMAEPVLWESSDPETPHIILFPTMEVPDSPGDLPAIEAGLEVLAEECSGWGLTSIAVPALGCGVGGLEFADILEAAKLHFDSEPVTVKLFEPR